MHKYKIKLVPGGRDVVASGTNVEIKDGVLRVIEPGPPRTLPQIVFAAPVAGVIYVERLSE